LKQQFSIDVYVGTSTLGGNNKQTVTIIYRLSSNFKFRVPNSRAPGRHGD